MVDAALVLFPDLREDNEPPLTLPIPAPSMTDGRWPANLKEAVLWIVEENPADWFSPSEVASVVMLRGWKPNDVDNLANAVRHQLRSLQGVNVLTKRERDGRTTEYALNPYR